MNTKEKRSLDQKRDWNFFDVKYPVPPDCLPFIQPYTDEAARAIWCESVHSDERYGHPQSLPSNAWPVQILSSSISECWMEDWDNEDSKNFEAWLHRTVSWPDDTRVIFTCSDIDSVETTWRVFCRCWRHFLFEDEGPFLWSLQKQEAIRFMPSGIAFYGLRTEQAS